MSSTQALRSIFKGDIVTSDDPGYEDAISRWTTNAVRKAQMVVFVKDAEDASLAVKFALAANLKIAIRGGGHSPSGASSRDGGLVIDLSKYLNGVRVDPDKKLAYVGGGALWATVDKAAIQHGLATVGGTVNHTGVGGLALGGGYGWLSGSHGLVIDNIEQVTIVTADGSILKASSTENPDLFWGIRGGGSNFGVVTEFVLRLHPQRRTVYAGKVIFSPDKGEVLSEILGEWWPRITPKEGVFVALTRDPNRNPCILLALFYNGPEAEGRANFKKIFDVGPLADLTGEIPYENLNGMMLEIATPGLNYYMKGYTLQPQLAKDLIPKVLSRITELSSDGIHNYIAVLLEFVSQSKINSVPKDATPYPRTLTGNAVVVIQWDKLDTPEKLRLAKHAAQEVTKLMPEGDGYSNYSCEATTTTEAAGPSKSQAQFKEHYPRLQAIKKKYDPNLVFDRWFVIEPTRA
ncbi:hypothetical protein NLI96_g9981 [Meripilus lineatus]|uniref:FAD-binding PCMH-type domain-containing protein n=1 Tax=Meripilus lineatus TaxID=2056292 RepID=A0AAD5UUH9_9APHY|nr:hypothetical protein NLI96_g9981 [Physisporinus lineatus]